MSSTSQKPFVVTASKLIADYNKHFKEWEVSVEKERLLNGEKSETLKNIKVVDVAKVSSDYCCPCTAVMKQVINKARLTLTFC